MLFPRLGLTFSMLKPYAEHLQAEWDAILSATIAGLKTGMAR